MSGDNVTPIRSGSEPPAPPRSRRDLEAAEVPLEQAIAIVDLLQGAACHAAIEPPANEESLARALAVVLDLLNTVRGVVFPRESTDAGEDEP